MAEPAPHTGATDIGKSLTRRRYARAGRSRPSSASTLAWSKRSSSPRATRRGCASHTRCHRRGCASPTRSGSRRRWRRFANTTAPRPGKSYSTTAPRGRRARYSTCTARAGGTRRPWPRRSSASTSCSSFLTGHMSWPEGSGGSLRMCRRAEGGGPGSRSIRSISSRSARRRSSRCPAANVAAPLGMRTTGTWRASRVPSAPTSPSLATTRASPRRGPSSSRRLAASSG
mmetsp:Transcript_36522/g.117728  ORF Transcript_36522/g.117728 Transcript_36522/m.117728 type:complete len:229 (+) Transcript_36522:520-1206(+)